MSRDTLRCSEIEIIISGERLNICPFEICTCPRGHVQIPKLQISGSGFPDSGFRNYRFRGGLRAACTRGHIEISKGQKYLFYLLNIILFNLSPETIHVDQPSINHMRPIFFLAVAITAGRGRPLCNGRKSFRRLCNNRLISAAGRNKIQMHDLSAGRGPLKPPPPSQTSQLCGKPHKIPTGGFVWLLNIL